MADALPPELSALLDRAAPDQDRRWEAFVAIHHRLLLHVTHVFAKAHDPAMDAFAWILDRLRENDFQRLRGYTADGRSEFTTWLVVVARRLCLDWYRTRYGRERATMTPVDRNARRRLVDLMGENIDTIEIPEVEGAGPDVDVQTLELEQALRGALAGLDPSDRLLLKLRFDDGLSGADIADFMRLPSPFHVYRRIARVLDSLRRALVARGVEGPVP